MGEVEYCQVTTTTDSRQAADGLARGAVLARVAACGQVVGPIASTYWWQGQVETAEEWLVVFKTTLTRYADLEAYIRANHTYEVPEVLCTPVLAGDRAYLDWLSAETRPEPTQP